MIGVKEKVMKKCFFKRKDGSSGCVCHRSVILSDGSIIRCQRFMKEDGGVIVEFSREFERRESKVSKSLMIRQLSVSEDQGRIIKEKEKFYSLKEFSERMGVLVGVEGFFEVLNHIR